MRLLLVDDHALFRSGVRLLVQQRGEAVSIVEASTAQDGLAIAQSTSRPDLVLLDLNLPGLDGPSGVAEFVRILSTRVPVVVVSGEDESTSSDACLAAGAVEFVHKSSGPERLERVLDKYLLSSTRHTMSTSGTGLPQLTPRQMEVLRALAQGLPNKEIARALNVSPNTIKVHLAVSVRSTHLECELRSGHRPHDWRIVETMEQISNEGRPRRREYSKDFKAEVLAKCRQPGASVGGVALAHGLHSNMVHRWIREAGAAYRAPLGMPGSQIAQAMQPRFTPVPLDLLSPAVPQAPAGSADQTAPTAPRPVELQLRRGDLIVSVQCPLEHCGTLLREVLR